MPDQRSGFSRAVSTAIAIIVLIITFVCSELVLNLIDTYGAGPHRGTCRIVLPLLNVCGPSATVN